MTTPHTFRNWVPEFQDSSLERAFRAHQFSESIRYSQVVLAVGCLSVMVLVVNDYLFWKISPQFFILVAARAISTTLGVGLIWAAGSHIRTAASMDRWMLAWMTSLNGLCVIACWLRPPEFTLHIMVVQVVILAAYLFVPMRFPHRVLSGIGGSVAYIAMLWLTKPMGVTEIVPIIWAFIISNMVGMTTSAQLHRLRRLDYARLTDEHAVNVRLSDEIRERQRLVSELAERDRYLTHMFEVTPVALALTDVAQGTVLRANRNFLDLLHVERNEIPAIRFADCFSANDAPQNLPIELANTGLGREMHIATRRGDMPWVLISARSLDFEGRPCLILSLVDISIRKAEEQTLRDARAAAEEANLAKSRFLAAASHDLRQPIHALGMFVGALRARVTDAEATRIIDHIDDSLHTMGELFSSLLDVSRLDAGIVQPRLEVFAIQPLLERVHREFQEAAQEKGLKLVLHSCSLHVHSDPMLLGRIVRNLVANAVRYSESGRVVIGCGRRSGKLSIQVLDTGSGIATEHRDLIFQEFYQIGNDERDRNKGLGLGLAIVRRLTTLLETPLRLRSSVGKGSAFSIDVPIAIAVPFVPAREDLREPAFAMRGLILIVDDEATVLRAMQNLLTSWGLDVITAGSCNEMLAQLASCDVRPRLIICDYRLRDGERGINVIRRLQSEYNDDIPGVLITGDTAPDRLKEAQESGFVLLHKPVPNARLRATLSSLMRPADAASVTA